MQGIARRERARDTARLRRERGRTTKVEERAPREGATCAADPTFSQNALREVRERDGRREVSGRWRR